VRTSGNIYPKVDIDLEDLNFWLKALENDRHSSIIVQITLIAVDKTLRDLEGFECKLL